MDDTAAKLASPAVVQALQHASAERAREVLTRLPTVWFTNTRDNRANFVRLVRATAGPAQAQVIVRALAGGGELLEGCSVPEHLVLASRVGQDGTAQAVDTLCKGWRDTVRAPELLHTLVSTLAASALTCHNRAAWEAIVQQDPSQLDRRDRLRLAARRACTPDQVTWALTHGLDAPWSERVEVAWDFLRRSWSQPPAPFPVGSPELAVEAARALVEGLPWEDPAVAPAVSAAFNHAHSPLRQLLENDFRHPPVERLRALEACRPLVDLLHARGVALEQGPEVLARATHRHSARMAMAHP